MTKQASPSSKNPSKRRRIFPFVYEHSNFPPSTSSSNQACETHLLCIVQMSEDHPPLAVTKFLMKLGETIAYEQATASPDKLLDIIFMGFWVIRMLTKKFIAAAISLSDDSLHQGCLFKFKTDFAPDQLTCSMHWFAPCLKSFVALIILKSMIKTHQRLETQLPFILVNLESNFSKGNISTSYLSLDKTVNK